MKDQLISFKIAKLAKEKGFNEGSYNVWHSEGKYTMTSNSFFRDGGASIMSNEKGHIEAPTQTFLHKWLWENHKIWVEITLWGDGIGFTCMLKYVKGTDDDGSSSVYGKSVGNNHNPYLLLEKGLQEALKLIKLEDKPLHLDPTKDYEALKKVYKNAVKNKEENIVYKGNDMLPGYTKYLLEHWANLLDLKN